MINNSTDITKISQKQHKEDLTIITAINFLKSVHIFKNKKLSYHRGIAQCVVSVKTSPTAAQWYKKIP